MEIQLNLEALRKRKLMIGTLLHGPTAGYFRSMFGLSQLLSEQGIPAEVQLLTNESDISLARNKLTDTFLRSDCTELLQVDNDVSFEPWDVLGMMHFDKEVIGANCPRKQIDWNLIREAVLLQPDIDPDKLSLMGATWMAAISADCKEIKLEEPIKYDSIPAGFSLIKRSAFGRMAPIRSTFYLEDEHEITDFWSAGPYNERWETEDYAFCHCHRRLGGEVWLCPWIKLQHEGGFAYQGDFATVLQHFSTHKRCYTLLTA